MPCLEIAMPAVEEKVRAELTQKLTDRFDEVAPFGREIFGILFREYGLTMAAGGGELVSDVEKRPYLHFLLYCPRVSRTIKQKLVAGWTEDFCACLGRPDWKPVIHICEHPYDNVGVEGQLLSDAFEACANSRFYYELPKD